MSEAMLQLLEHKAAVMLDCEDALLGVPVVNGKLEVPVEDPDAVPLTGVELLDET